jgi:hypothetical protein
MLAGVSASSRAGSPLRPFSSFGLACWSLVIACSEGSGEAASVASGSEEGADGSGGVRELAAAELAPCAPAPGTTGSPSSIAETVDLVNGLPKPVSLACFLEALERPLRLVATQSFFSAQPAMGSRSPRIFVFMEGIIHSIVPAGTAQNLLEMGEVASPGWSIKAELEFPITENITLATAFERLPLDGITTCGVCHDGRAPALGIEGAFESEVLRPADQELVSIAELADEARRCDEELEPARCAMLGALFEHGEVIATEFPSSVRTIFD